MAGERLDDALAPASYTAWRAASSAMQETASQASLGEALEAAGENARTAIIAAVHLAGWRGSRAEPWESASFAARALVVRNLIPEIHFTRLTKVWRDAGLPLPRDVPIPSLAPLDEEEASTRRLYGAAIALVQRCSDLTPSELQRLTKAWDAVKAGSPSQDALRTSAREIGRLAGRWPVWRRARSATAAAALSAGLLKLPEKTLIAPTDAALALVVRDLISPRAFDSLTRPWREAGLTLPQAPT